MTYSQSAADSDVQSECRLGSTVRVPLRTVRVPLGESGETVDSQDFVVSPVATINAKSVYQDSSQYTGSHS